MPVKKKRRCAEPKVDFEMYAVVDRGNAYCDEITERDGQNFLTPCPLLFPAVPIQPNPLAIPCLFDSSSCSDGRGTTDGASVEDERIRLAVDATQVRRLKP